MVSQNDLLLLGGGLLAIMYFQKGRNDVKTVQYLPDIPQIETINLKQIEQAETVKQQLENIRSQILEQTKAQGEQKIQFIETNVQEAQRVGSLLQRKLAEWQGLIRTYTRKNMGFQAKQVAEVQAREKEGIMKAQRQIEQFVSRGQLKVEEIRQEQAELEQIV